MIVHLDTERDLELAKQKRVEEIRARMFYFFHFFSLLSTPAHLSYAYRPWHEWDYQWHIGHHCYKNQRRYVGGGAVHGGLVVIGHSALRCCSLVHDAVDG
jgi:hypothetical protein